MDVVYGANIPSVARKVEKHLSMKNIGESDKTGRYYYEFDELLPEEREKYEKLKAIEDVNWKRFLCLIMRCVESLNFVTERRPLLESL